jgi:hypothetical protein
MVTIYNGGRSSYPGFSICPLASATETVRNYSYYYYYCCYCYYYSRADSFNSELELFYDGLFTANQFVLEASPLKISIIDIFTTEPLLYSGNPFLISS